MDSFRLNKYMMAFLGTVFIIMSISLLSESFFHTEIPEQAGYEIVATEAPAGGGTATAAAGPAYDPIEGLLANADLAAGEKVFKKCAACHTVEKGGANKVGPHIYGVVGRPIASIADFGYSAGMKAFAEGGKTWTFEELNGFLFKPKTHVKGTAMGFAGLKKTGDRANLIGWLNSNSDSPLPLPPGS